MGEQTWEQRLRAAAAWLRERHATATASRRCDGSLPGGRVVSVDLLLDAPDWPYPAMRLGGTAEDGWAGDPDGQHAAELVAALVGMVGAIADLLEGEADKQKLWFEIISESMPDVVIDAEEARSVSPSWIRGIVEAVEAVRGVTA